MTGELVAEQIDHMLHLEVVGRIGCHASGRTHVVPLTYTYDGHAIYAFSFEGLKLRIMRENPEVCFEVDRFNTLASWRAWWSRAGSKSWTGEEGQGRKGDAGRSLSATLDALADATSHGGGRTGRARAALCRWSSESFLWKKSDRFEKA
jgi:Pyridoxamine 5'-phosphate oxidase